MCVCVCVTMCLLSAPVPPLMNSSIHLAPGGGISSRAVSASTALAVRDTRPSQVSHKDAQTNITATDARDDVPRPNTLSVRLSV